MRGGIKKRTGFLSGLFASAAMLLLLAAPASAAPVWKIDSVANTSAPEGGQATYRITVLNVGSDAATTSVPIKFTAALPADLTAAEWGESCPEGFVGQSNFVCTLNPSAGDLESRGSFSILLTVDVAPTAEGVLTAEFEIAGGGAEHPASTVDPTTIGAVPPYGFDGFDAQALAGPLGQSFTQAAGHPFALNTYAEFNRATRAKDESIGIPVESAKDTWVDLPKGLLGSPSAFPQCSLVELSLTSPGAPLVPVSECPLGSQVGTVSVPYAGAEVVPFLSLYNLEPSPGMPARFGFNIAGTVVVLNARLRSDGDYGISVGLPNAPQALAASGGYFEFWGTPGDAIHDFNRSCPGGPPVYGVSPNALETCESGVTGKPFLRMPTGCDGPLPWSAHTSSWENPGAVLPSGAPDLSDPNWKSTSIVSHEAPGFPLSPEDQTTPWGEPQGLNGCELVPVKGTLEAQTTSIETETPTGLEVHVEVPNPGLENPEGIASSDLKSVKVTLPQGVTINPSQAEGLGVCSPPQYESTELSFHPTSGKGCPDNSKIGTVAVKTPLLEETIPGDVYIAEQDDPTTSTPGAENPFDSLLAIYVVLAEPQRGVLVKLPGEVETDEKSGRIVTSFDDLPQLPFSTFDFKFREGARAPLVTPPTCGTYETVAEFTGHSDPDGPPLVSKSTFEIVRGIGGGPCPPGGVPGFKPGFTAGSINNNAGSYSPFYMRLTRLDGEQNLTKFSSVLPPGVSAKIAGVEKCSDGAIAAAKGRTGRAELASPSCPANSQIGRTLAGAGVGSVLTNVPGKLYLAGPYNGAPLSVVAITPAVAGPFDVGTVVVQEGLALDPRTAEVRVDGSASDPIPHILEGIPLKLRDLRVYVDRDKFTIVPTSCDPSSVKATLYGSFLDVFSPADDVPVALSDRYQASNCARLGFEPRLKLRLLGPTHRGAHPALRGVLRPRPGDANVERVQVTLPSTELLENAHIRTICTRVQYAANGGHGAGCPKGSIYGRVKAWTPLLEEPLQGPVYLRSSNHQLPDMVLALRGIVDIEAVGVIDSKNGRIRTTFDDIPDAPIGRVVLSMQGGKKGLLVNSAQLCKARPRARALIDGHNGKPGDSHPRVRARCGKGKRR